MYLSAWQQDKKKKSAILCLALEVIIQLFPTQFSFCNVSYLSTKHLSFLNSPSN